MAKPENEMNTNIINKAISKAGGVSALSREMDTYPQQIQHWRDRNKPLPVKHVVKMCQFLGDVKPHDIRPDVFMAHWEV